MNGVYYCGKGHPPSQQAPLPSSCTSPLSPSRKTQVLLLLNLLQPPLPLTSSLQLARKAPWVYEATLTRIVFRLCLLSVYFYFFLFSYLFIHYLLIHQGGRRSFEKFWKFRSLESRSLLWRKKLSGTFFIYFGDTKRHQTSPTQRITPLTSKRNFINKKK